MTPPLQILQGHVLHKLQEMPDNSVQCVVTSPPYWGLRIYVDQDDPDKVHEIGLERTPEEYISKMVAVFEEVRRVLRPDGTCWVNLGDCYAHSGSGGHGATGGAETSTLASPPAFAQCPTRRHFPRGLKPKDLIGMPWRLAFALQESGWYLRSDIIWHKPNPMPESVQDRPTKSHEYIFLLTKNQKYFYDTEAIKEPCSEGTHARLPGNVKPSKSATAYERGALEHRTKAGLLNYAKRKRAEAGNGIKNNNSFDEAMAIMSEFRNKRTVWTVSTFSYSDAHFATFPPDLIKPCILAGTKPGDVVLDPFGGSGTTGQVALELGRHAILIELNKKYIPLIEQRTNVTPGLPI